VEDDVDTCEVLHFLFRDYDISFSHTLESALPVIEGTDFDLYILDNWLPDGSGIDLCRTIRAKGSASPIVFTSAAAAGREVDAAASAGADRYVVKPCDPQNLHTIVKELLEKP
jgi:DNA-binding response OmpR family regulator